MLTLRQYLDQFTRKQHTVELRRLMDQAECTRQHIYALADGRSSSLNTALRIYRATQGQVDPRTLARKEDWEALDAYYRQEQGLAAPPTLHPAVARAGRARVAAKAGVGIQRAGRKAGAQGAGKAARKGTTKV